MLRLLPVGRVPSSVPLSGHLSPAIAQNEPVVRSLPLGAVCLPVSGFNAAGLKERPVCICGCGNAVEQSEWRDER